MATQTGILQALWGEVRPSVEARDPSAAATVARLVHRGKCQDALSAWGEVLQHPPILEADALGWVARRASLPDWENLLEDLPGIRERLWDHVTAVGIPSLLNCRLLLDEPYPDRVWLYRHGAWVLYSWDGTRLDGRPLAQVLGQAGKDPALRRASLLVLAVNGRSRPNPKLPLP